MPSPSRETGAIERRWTLLDPHRRVTKPGAVSRDGIWVTLDWGTPKVHLASGAWVLMCHTLADPESYVEIALCGYVRGDQPSEGTEGEVDADSICGRCLAKRRTQPGEEKG